MERMPRSRRQWAAARIFTAETVVFGLTGVWILLVGIPLLGLILYSILKVVQFHVVLEFTTASWREVLESGRGEVMLRTLRIATTVTLIELLTAFPFAFWLSKRLKSIPVKVVILTLTVVPFFLSSAARAIVWRPILSSTGLINNLLVESGLSHAPVEWLLFTEISVHFGLVLAFFPSMLFPLFLSISMIDDEYLSASSDLGGTPFQTLWAVTLPLSSPGIVAGVVFTIVPMLGEVAVPRLLGGGNVNLMGQSVESALNALNYGAAASMCSFVLIVLMLLLVLLQWIARRSGLLSGGFGSLAR
jgi:ABC-type spermidine/putrescine transport system permease subunit I